MENLQNLLGNFGNWMGYPICDLIGSETDDEVEDLSKIDYYLWWTRAMRETWKKCFAWPDVWILRFR